MSRAELPAPGEFIVLRTDDLRADKQNTERHRYGEAIADGKLSLIGEARVGKFEFEIYKAR